MGANAVTAIVHASNLTPTTGSHSDHWLDLCLTICFNLILLRFFNSQVPASYQLRFLTIFFHFIMFIHYRSGVHELASKLQSRTELIETKKETFSIRSRREFTDPLSLYFTPTPNLSPYQCCNHEACFNIARE